MNILFTCSVFLMGLLSSIDWLRFRSDTEAQKAGSAEHLLSCSCADSGRIVLKNNNHCLITISTCLHHSIKKERQDTQVPQGHMKVIGLLYKVTKDHCQSGYPANEAETIQLSLSQSGQYYRVLQTCLPEKVVIILAEENSYLQQELVHHKTY